MPLLPPSWWINGSPEVSHCPANTTVLALSASLRVNQVTCSHFYLRLTFSSVEGSWKKKNKTQWKNKGCTFTSERLSWHHKCCSAVVPLFPKLSQPVLGKNISQFTLSFPYSFFTMMAEGMRLCPSPVNVAAGWAAALLRRGTQLREQSTRPWVGILQP